MCTLVLFFRVFPDYPIVIAANRDESLSRPSTHPTQLWSPPWVFGGQDLLAGGTWLGVNEWGVSVGVLNRQASAPADPLCRSRGQLCLDALKQKSAAAAVHAITTRTDHSYNPFNLVIADSFSAYVVDNHSTTLTTRQLPTGIHFVTNRDPNDTACARIARFSPRFAEISDSFSSGPLSLPNLFGMLHHQMAQHADPPGDARDGLCLHLDGYGTCSSTLIAYSREERRYNYYFAPGPPCQTSYREVSLPPAPFASHPPSTR
jgi:hypothetical protein